MHPRGSTSHHETPPARECLVPCPLPPGGRPAPHLQLADPVLQRPRASGDGGLLRHGGLEASDDPVRVLDLALQAQGGSGSVSRQPKVRPSLSHTPAMPPSCPLPQSPEHSLLPVEVAENQHVAVLVLDTVESQGQVQGSGAPRPGGQKRLTLLLGRLLLCSQALQLLGCPLGQGGAGSEVSFLPGQPDPAHLASECGGYEPGHRPETGDSPGPESPRVDDPGQPG